MNNGRHSRSSFASQATKRTDSCDIDRDADSLGDFRIEVAGTGRRTIEQSWDDETKPELRLPLSMIPSYDKERHNDFATRQSTVEVKIPEELLCK